MARRCITLAALVGAVTLATTLTVDQAAADANTWTVSVGGETSGSATGTARLTQTLNLIPSAVIGYCKSDNPATPVLTAKATIPKLGEISEATPAVTIEDAIFAGCAVIQSDKTFNATFTQNGPWTITPRAPLADGSARVIIDFGKGFHVAETTSPPGSGCNFDIIGTTPAGYDQSYGAIKISWSEGEPYVATKIVNITNCRFSRNYSGMSLLLQNFRMVLQVSANGSTTPAPLKFTSP